MTEEFENFADQFTDKLMERLSSEGLSTSIGVHTVEKLGGTYEAATIRTSGSEIAVNVNLSEAYQKLQEGKAMDQLVDHAAKQATEALARKPQISAADILNYEKMKHRIDVEVVSAGRNAGMLKNIPHEQMEDMAVVYRILLDTNDSTKGRHENSAKISACITERTYQNRKIPVIIPLLQMCKRKGRKNRIRA